MTNALQAFETLTGTVCMPTWAPMFTPIWIIFNFFPLLPVCLKVLMLECLNFSHTTGSCTIRGEWRYNWDAVKVFCSFLCWSCENTDSAMSYCMANHFFVVFCLWLRLRYGPLVCNKKTIIIIKGSLHSAVVSKLSCCSCTINVPLEIDKCNLRVSLHMYLWLGPPATKHLKSRDWDWQKLVTRPRLHHCWRDKQNSFRSSKNRFAKKLVWNVK